jgi:signal transduction histidine kinase
MAWSIPAVITVFFLTLGFDAPFIDLATRWLCVGMTAYLAMRFSVVQSPSARPVEQDARPAPLYSLLTLQQTFVNLNLPDLLQQFIDEMAKIIPSRGSALILLDHHQEEPEYVLTHGHMLAAIGKDFPTLLSKEVFLEVLERRALVFNNPQELQSRLAAHLLKEFVHQNLFVGCIRHRQHLAFLFLADRVGQTGFLPQDLEVFSFLAENMARAIANARTVENLRATERRQRELLHGLVNAQEQESKQIAAEWHERISKKLFHVFQGLRGFLNLIVQRTPENESRFRQLIAEVDEIAALVRGLANELHPTMLYDFGLAAAIREYIADAVAGFATEEPLQVTVQADDVDHQLPSDAKLIIFRITQEAIRNIRRHAEAKNVHIAFFQEHSGVSLMIKDDGKGFNPNQPQPGHFGLQYMRERAESCGGTFQVVSAQGQGTEVRVNFPGVHKSDQ